MTTTYVVIEYPSTLVLARVPFQYVDIVRTKVSQGPGPNNERPSFLIHGTREEIDKSFPQIEKAHLERLDEVAPKEQVIIEK